MKYINKTKAYKEIERREGEESSYIGKLNLLEEYLKIEYGKLPIHFGKYTRHDWKHTLKVLDYMYDLIDIPAAITTEQIMLIVYSALLHDIGMAWTREEIVKLIPNLDLSNEERITEIIRAKHGELAEKKIKSVPNFEEYRNLFAVRSNGALENWDLSNIVASLCHSHVQPICWIKTKFGNYPDVIFIACLLRLADLLDIDGGRANTLYQIAYDIQGISGTHYKFNKIVGDSRKILTCSGNACEENCPNRVNNRQCGKFYKTIELTITFPVNMERRDEATIRRMISDYTDDIETEIVAVNKLLSELDSKYRIKLSSTVRHIINPIYTATHPQIDTQKISVDYSAIKQVLFGEQLYLKKLYAIRELVQNAYDACKAFLELNSEEIGWDAKILIYFDAESDTLRIRDNGIGMSNYVIREYFLNIGKSIYNYEPAYLYDDYHKDHIGHFGLGFWAAFMLSTKIEIHTQSYTSNTSTTIELDKSSNFATLVYNQKPMGHGTEVVLNFKDVRQALKQDDNNACLELLTGYIRETFLFDKIKIYFSNGSATNFQELPLKCIASDAEDIISRFLAAIEACVNISHKEFPPIFYAQSHNAFVRLEYNDLLLQLARNDNASGVMPYLDAGNFLIFPGNEAIKEDFMLMAERNNPRRNYSPITSVSNSISCEISKFCEDNCLEMPTHCNYVMLTILVDGNNVALCEQNVVCASHRTMMRRYDACGEPQLNDSVFLRDVLLPQLHILLPYINFRYDFNGLLANIKTINVFPTLARDTITDEKAKSLSCAIGYAIARLEIDKGLNKPENKLILEHLYKEIDNNIFIKRRDE